MKRIPTAVLAIVVLLGGLCTVALAQTGAGSLSGYIKDASGGILPGVTVTATSPALIQPASSTTDSQGYYRLINLPPGTYAITAELPGFAGYRQEGVLLRAGANFTVDITLKLGTITESVTVSGESPMLETSLPSNVLNISGEFQRDMPIQARRNWSDFLELTPGVHSRPFDDGSGRMVYFGHGTEHFAHVIQVEGAIASNYQDAQVTYVAMGADMIDDVQVKTGGVDAAAPMGTGLNINVITKSGGNQFKGSGGFAYQPDDSNANNAANCSPSAGCHPATITTGGTPTTAIVRQFDGALGGPVSRDRTWFFGSLRYADLESGISRTKANVDLLHQFAPTFALFNNKSTSWQPYAKVTTKLTRDQEIAAFYQGDRLTATGDREYNYSRSSPFSTGGGLYGAKLTSVWSQNLTSTMLVAYNNKGGNSASTWEGADLGGPDVTIWREASLQGDGTLRGKGRLVEGGNVVGGVEDIRPSSLWTIRADLTYFKSGWIGSHEFQTGFFGEPWSKYDTTLHYLNNGFIVEDRRPINANDPLNGTVPFHRQYVTSGLDATSRLARDRDLAFYGQDSWRPTERLTTTVGVRFDFTHRFDKLFNVTRENAHIVQPRVGFSYLVTQDARNVLRGSYSRLGEQMMGRDGVTTFGGDATVSFRDIYDVDGNGTFSKVLLTPAITQAVAANQFDPNLHQPYVDEFILGFRKQFPYQIGLDVAGINRVYKDTYGRVEENGIYPSGPFQPFGGFGAIDPNRGTIYMQTNNSWSRLRYTALEITITKNMSHHFQLISGINRQWQHISGTWNPHDPAAFVQPTAFPNDRLLYMPRGNNEDNSLPLQNGTTVNTYGPTWQKYRLNFGGTYQAPLGVTLAASYTIQAGPWSGPIVDQLPSADPRVTIFGPGTVVSSTGFKASNPLATRTRFAFATRGDGQVLAPPIKTLGLKIGKKLPLGGSRSAEVAANIFNILNAGDYTQYNYNGANQRFDPDNFLQMRNQQPARAAQLTVIYRF